MEKFITCNTRKFQLLSVETDILSWYSCDNEEMAITFWSGLTGNCDNTLLFEREDAFPFEELDEKLKESDVIVIGTKILNLGENLSSTAAKWGRFNDKDSILEFIETLSIDEEIFFFKAKDDKFEVYYNALLERIKKAEEYAFRHQTFKGDIIITDPCYIVKERDESNKPKWEDFHPYKSMYDYPDYDGIHISKEFKKNSEKYDEAYEIWNNENPDDWSMCGYGDNFENLGFSSNYLSHRTLYGDWSCTTFNSDTKEPIGTFCADSGMVGVFLLEEVLKYNPDYINDIGSHSVTLIKDFDGEVYFEKKNKNTLVVIGKGNINFETKQTGF